jgi:hypothetical protein
MNFGAKKILHRPDGFLLHAVAGLAAHLSAYGPGSPIVLGELIFNSLAGAQSKVSTHFIKNEKTNSSRPPRCEMATQLQVNNP